MLSHYIVVGILQRGVTLVVVGDRWFLVGEISVKRVMLEMCFMKETSIDAEAKSLYRVKRKQIRRSEQHLSSR